MLRGKKLVIISHCIINQNSVVLPLARAKGAFKITNLLIDKGVGIIQLPCPEFKFLGLQRKPMSKEEYDTKEYRELCRCLFIPILDEIIHYKENGYELVGIIGINGSGTCSITGKRGIFMEEIFNILENTKIKLPYYEIKENYEEDNYFIVEKELENIFNL